MMSMLQEKRSVRPELFVSPSFLGPSQLDGETSKIFLTDFSRKLEKWTGAHIFQMGGLTTKYKCDQKTSFWIQDLGKSFKRFLS